jgi:hypothetical protein
MIENEHLLISEHQNKASVFISFSPGKCSDFT